MKDKSYSQSNSASVLGGSACGGGTEMVLEYSPPLRFEELLEFFRMRAIAHVEVIDSISYARCVRLSLPSGEEVCGHIRVRCDADQNALVLQMSESLLPVASIVEARVRAMFDLDCNPQEVHAGLATLECARSGAVKLGTRLPGAFDAFETCCRAVLGQQISVSAANKLAARVVAAAGVRVCAGECACDAGGAGLELTWPTPAEVLAIPDIEAAWGQLGVIKNRTRAIVEIARLFESGALTFDAKSSAHEQMETLLNIKGIGPWTANYILMRVMSFPDAFLETDAGVVHALPNTTPKERLQIVESCRPWRSYAVVSLWNSLGGKGESNTKTKSKSAAATRKNTGKKSTKAKTKKTQKTKTYFTEYESSLIGTLTIASNGCAITGCWFNNDRYFGCGVQGEMQRSDALEVFKQVREWFDEYFEGAAPSPRALPLDAQGTPFQKMVREAMLDIPYGKTTTYGQIAKDISAQTGRSPCAQAVGGAVGHNPLCVIVPCHRVVGKSGSLTGFGGGIDMKVKLLEHEGADMSRFFVPTRGTALDPKTWGK